jgi:hypothetical protein
MSKKLFSSVYEAAEAIIVEKYYILIEISIIKEVNTRS